LSALSGFAISATQFGHFTVQSLPQKLILSLIVWKVLVGLLAQKGTTKR
jgi:hypothetical protein